MTSRNEINSLTIGRYYPALASRELRTDFKHRTGEDNVINSLCDKLSTWNKITVEDALSDLKPPYRSAAPELLNQKKQADSYIKSRGDPQAEQRRAELKNLLHDLEVKRLALQRSLDANALTQQEGNVRLGDIAQRKNEIADRLNLVDEEQGIFTGHVGDLNSKNQELVNTLRAIEKDEAETQKRTSELGEEKVRLAKRLAEVTHEHNDATNHLAQLGARRITVADSLGKLHQDSETYHHQLKDLDESRGRLHALFRDLSSQEAEQVKQLQDVDNERSNLCNDLHRLEADIAAVQEQAVNSAPRPHPEVVVEGIEAPALDRVPPTVGLKPTTVTVPAPQQYPDGYLPAPPTQVPDVPPPQVTRGTYDLDPSKHVPLTPCPPTDKDTSQYYNLPVQKEAMPKTGWRSSYDVGITPASTFPPVHRGTSKAFSPAVRSSLPSQYLFNSTYQRSYGRKY
jgi:peptidoglycan hydrolase CwlO-like protein